MKTLAKIQVLLGTVALFGGQLHAQEYTAEISVSSAPYIAINKTLPESGAHWQLHLVPTRDEIYVPVGLRKPDGDGPFPVILIGSGQGREGIVKIEQSMDHFEELMGRLVERGYVAIFVNFRNEVPELYNEIASSALLVDNVSGGNRTLQSVPTLDSEDYLSIIAHAKALPYIDANGIGAIGSSHSGEIILKGTAVTDIAAAVPSEAAAIEYLAIDISDAPRDETGRELQMQDIELARRLANKEVAMQRIRNINTPLLILGRDDDHLQGIFQLIYEWSAEAGKDVIWESFDHPEHGYSLLGKAEGGVSDPDEMQNQVFELYMKFFDEHLK